MPALRVSFLIAFVFIIIYTYGVHAAGATAVHTCKENMHSFSTMDLQFLFSLCFAFVYFRMYAKTVEETTWKRHTTA